MKPHEQVIIIGGGPAGAACAVQLKRYGIDPLLLEKDKIGGLVRNAWRLDNYPGYPKGISGRKYSKKIKKHLKRFDIRSAKCQVRSAKFLNNAFEIVTDESVFRCDHLVIATGTRAKKVFDYPEEAESVIFYEVQPLQGIEGKDIAIIGAGDAAFDYAMSLAGHNRVEIYNRGDEIKCIPALLEIATANAFINYNDNIELEKIEVSNNILSLFFKNVISEDPILFDYVIFAAGREAELSFISGEMENNLEKLEQEGLLYVIGDVKNGMVRQTSVAIGDGIKAAMAIKDQIING